MKYSRNAFFVFLLFVFTYGYFLRTTLNWNVNSRLDLIFAVVDRGQLEIDEYHTAHYTFTGDKALHDGHYYSDKAIGTAILGVPVYAAVRWLAGSLKFDFHFYVVRYLIRLFVVVLPAAFALSLLYVACEYITGDRWRAYAITLILGLGTMLLPFSTLLFGHVLAAALLWIAFFLVLRLRLEPQRQRLGQAVLVGGVLAFALVTEYPAGIIVGALGLYYLWVLWAAGNWRRAALVLGPLLGAAVPLLLMFAYNARCFGSLFSLGYQYLARSDFHAVHSRGVVGVGWPSLTILYYITVHPIRGLFVQSPVLLASLAGLWFMWKRREWRVEALLGAFALVSMLLLNAGFPLWWGGTSFGPRYLIPALFFLGLPLAFVPARAWFVVVTLAAVSVLQMMIPTIGSPQAPDLLPELSRRGLAPFQGIPFFGASPIYGWCLNHLQQSGFYGFGGYAPNLGALLGLRGFASLLPLFAVWAGATYHIRRKIRGPQPAAPNAA